MKVIVVGLSVSCMIAPAQAGKSALMGDVQWN